MVATATNFRSVRSPPLCISRVVPYQTIRLIPNGGVKAL
jgi:hypothetical protein